MKNPVTVEDFTPRACRERLERIMESGPRNTFRLSRDEMQEIVRHLRTLDVNGCSESAAEPR